MDGWLGLLVIAGLFFVMMRFGCGAHMMRSHGKDAGGTQAGHGGCGGERRVPATAESTRPMNEGGKS